jgi:hypothetical protein
MTEIGSGDGQPIAPSELTVSHEDDAFRRAEIGKLAVDFLKMRNPAVERSILEAAFYAKQDIFSDRPLDEVARHDPDVGSLDDASSMARFYLDNPEVNVPTEVMVISDLNTIPSDLSSKVLLYINESASDKGDVDQKLAFTTTARAGFRSTKSQMRPDVYIARINDEVGKFMKRKKRKSFSISGCDNLLLDESISYRYNPEPLTLSFGAEGQCALLPGANIVSDRHNKVTNIRIGAKDVVQYPGSKIAIHDVNCVTYTQLGGEIIPPYSGVTTIRCEDFYPRGGERMDPPYLDIQGRFNNEDYLDRLGNSIPERVIAAGRVGLLSPSTVTAPAAEPGEPGGREERLEVSLDAPRTEKIMADGTEIRGYVMPNDAGQYTDFITDAIVEGWEVVTTAEVGYQQSVVLRRKLEESETPQEPATE